MEAALVPSQLLGELFVEKGLITHDELEKALVEQKLNGKRLGEILVKQGFVSGPALTTVLAEQLGVEMETQEGFGSGLWWEIKRRHLRGRSGDERDPQLDVEEPELAAEPQFSLIDGLSERIDEREIGEPAADASALDGELQSLRQQVSFAAERLDEERAAHEGTQRLLDEARAEAEAHSREADDWRERVASAEDSGQEVQTPRADFAELNGVVTDVRVELAAREEALRLATEAQTDLAGDLARLAPELADLRDGRAEAEDHLTVLTKQLEDERTGHATTSELLEAARTEAVELAVVVAELRAELVRREETLQRDTEAEAERDAELAQLRADALVLHQRLDDERAEYVASRREIGRLESQLSEIAPVTALLDEADRELAARTDELVELATELEHARGLLAERDAASPVEEIVADHIVFRPGAGGYELAERPGPAPEVGTVEDVDGERFLVTRIGRSPLPADRRRCAYLEAA